MTCGLCRQIEAIRAHGAPRRRASVIRVDHAALRQALGGRGEVVERAVARVAGHPTVNAAVLWAFFTSSVYQSVGG